MVRQMSRDNFENDMHFLNAPDPLADIRRSRTTLQSAMHGGYWQGEIVRMAPGKGPDSLDMVSTPAVSLVHVRFPHEATVRAEQPRGFLTFTLPATDGDLLRINGVRGRNGALFINYGCEETYSYAPTRNLIAGRVNIEMLLAILGQITGSTLQDDAIPRGLISLSPSAQKRLVRIALTVIHGDEASDRNAVQPKTQFLQAFARALLSVHEGESHVTKALQIVKQARAMLDAKAPTQPRLPEMCEAARCSAPVVTGAFNDVTGTSPSKYVRYLCLARAHQALCCGTSDAPLVKAAALNAGFTELGRFSGLYSRVYGQLPSQTLGEGG